MFQPKGVGVSSASNVLFPFGSPNTMGVGALCYVSFAMIAPHVAMGRMLVNMFTDMENAEMLVVWGANPATDSPPLDMHRLLATAQLGADIVVIDPHHTETARRTNAQWVPIRPGTDAALALSMIGLRGESLVVALDQHGISLSSGSACKPGSPDPTHVLIAMGRTADEAHCAVRFSLSHATSKLDIDETVSLLGRVLKEMETTVRFLPCK